MYVTDLVVEKDSLGLMKKKLFVNRLFLYLFVFSTLMSIAMIVFAIVKKIGDFNTYLFGAFALLISVFWLYYDIKTLKTSKFACLELEQTGKYTIRKVVEVNAEHKHNTSTIFTLICAVVVSICAVIAGVMQCIRLDLLTLYIVPMLVVLAIFSCYQASNNLIDDKIYRNCIFNQNK